MDVLVDHGMPISMVPWVDSLDDGYLIAPGHDRLSAGLPKTLADDYKVADCGKMPTYSWNKDEQRNMVDGGTRTWRKACSYSRTNGVQKFLYTVHITDFDPGTDTEAVVGKMIDDEFVPHRIMACPITGGVQTQHRIDVPVSHKNQYRMDTYRKVNRMIAQRYGGDPDYVNQSAGYSPYSALLWTMEVDTDPYDMHKTREIVGLDGQFAFDLGMPVESRHRKEGIGFRNCSLFDTVRKVGYREVRRYDDRSRFHRRVMDVGVSGNAKFQSPLGLPEVRGIVRSVVDFCWSHREELGFNGRSLPTHRENGIRSGMVRAYKARVRAKEALACLDGGMNVSNVAANMGVSRQTVYRWINAR